MQQLSQTPGIVEMPPLPTMNVTALQPVTVTAKPLPQTSRLPLALLGMAALAVLIWRARNR